MDFRDGLGTGLDTLVGAIVGWLIGSVFKASKAELSAAMARIEKRIEQIETENKSLIPRVEFQRTIDQLRQDHTEQFGAIRRDVAELRELIMARLK